MNSQPSKNPDLYWQIVYIPQITFEEFWRTIRAGKNWEGEVEHKNKNGDRVWISWTNRSICDENGDIRGVLSVGNDITDRVRAEKALREAKQEAEAANHAKSAFLANMSHEIRTPMNGVIGMAGLLLQTDMNDEQKEFAQTIQSSADTLLSIINDILDFSKIEAGKLDFEHIDFDLQSTVEAVIEMLAIKADQKNLEFGAIVHSDLPLNLKGDPGRLKQILINICSNAIKFTDQGQVFVEVTLEKPHDTHPMLRFQITDTGIGIPQERLACIFRSFSQADVSTTRKYGGTGLGLTISQQLVEMMGGKLSVESNVGNGSTFSFTAVFEKQKNPKTRAPLLPDCFKNKRILIVDDNKTNRRVLGIYLQSWGCRLEEAEDAPEALAILHQAYAQNDPIDMAIVDFMMPHMDGEDLGKTIKADPAFKATRLIMLSSRGLRGDAVRAKEIGFEDYLTKPPKKSQLFNSILAAFGQKIEAGQPELITRHNIGTARGLGIHVLLVEDNAINQKVTLNMLTKFGVTVEAVNNGQKALDAFGRKLYDIILMDIQMPVMDGLTATAKIRTIEANTGKASGDKVPHVPIIAMTANAMKGDRQRCFDAGMDDYLAKPVDPDELLAKLNVWSDQPKKSCGALPASAKVATPSDTEDKPPLDKRQALSRVMGDAEFLSDMIGQFQKHRHKQLDNLRNAVESQDPKELKRNAHSLKGAAANLGATKIEEVARELETMGKNNNMAGGREAIKRLNQEYTNLQKFVEDIQWSEEL